MSYLYDLRYYLFENLSARSNADNYQQYKRSRKYPDYLKQGAAVAGVAYLGAKYCSGHGVDVGAGRWPLPGARPIDNGPRENAYNILEDSNSLDYVFSSHLLEHLERPEDAIDEWLRVLKPGGVLVLYLPHPACEMWRPEYLRHHRWSPDPWFMEKYLGQRGDLNILEISYTPDAFFSFFIVARKRT